MTARDAIALKPCPFCGGKAKLCTGRAAEDAEFAQVICTDCRVQIDYFEDAYAPTADAVAAWNRRAAASPHMPADGWVLVPEGGPVELDDCPEGLFLFGGTLAVMTEYATMSKTVPPMRQRDAYIVESGEYFWGGTSRTVDRAKLMVQPLASRPKGGA